MSRYISARQRRRLATNLTLIVAALHGALLLTLAIAPEALPPRIHLWELLWAAERRAMFYPLAALLLLGPLLTLAAWRVPGKHCYYLLSIWGGSLLLLSTLFADRLWLMLRILWWRFGG